MALLRLNFLHEIESIKTQRQRDPLKLAMLGLLVIILAMAGYYGLRAGAVAEVERRVRGASNSWAEKEAAQGEAEKQIRELQATIERVKLLEGAVQNRFLWAPALALVDRATGPNIQITNLNGSGGSGSIKITVGGIVAGVEPRIAADDYLEQLTTVFKTRFPDAKASFDFLEEQPGKKVNLGTGEVGTARFSIGVSFTPTPPPDPPADSPAAEGGPA